VPTLAPVRGGNGRMGACLRAAFHGRPRISRPSHQRQGSPPPQDNYVDPATGEARARRIWCRRGGVRRSVLVGANCFVLDEAGSGFPGSPAPARRLPPRSPPRSSGGTGLGLLRDYMGTVDYLQVRGQELIGDDGGLGSAPPPPDMSLSTGDYLAEGLSPV